MATYIKERIGSVTPQKVEGTHWINLLRPLLVSPAIFAAFIALADRLPKIDLGNQDFPSQLNSNNAPESLQDVRGQINIPEGSEVRLSPNGEIVSFTVEGNGKVLVYLFDFNNLTVRQVLETGENDNLFTPSPNGRFLAYVSNNSNGEVGELRVFDCLNDEYIFRTKLAIRPVLLTWSSDGRLVVSSYSTSGTFDLEGDFLSTIDVTDGSRGGIAGSELEGPYGNQ